MIRDHVWRAPGSGMVRGRGGVPKRDRPCEYMNCRRPLAEHERASLGRPC